MEEELQRRHIFIKKKMWQQGVESVNSRQKDSACEKVGLNTGFKVNSRNFRIAGVRVSGPWGNVI